MASSKIAVLWTGGKDSALALARCTETHGPVSYLVTFVPEGPVAFRAHPLERMKTQADALGIAHLTVPIREPYREGYIAALRDLRERYGIGTVVTGDIDTVAAHPNWIRECCDGAGLDVLTPLWRNDRKALLEDLLARGIVAEVTYIADGALPSEWLGRRIDEDFIREAELLSRNTGIDICGENGEYHTMVCAMMVESHAIRREREASNEPHPTGY